MGLFNLFKPSKSILVVDGVSLNAALGNKGNVPPRAQLQTLRRLARFSQREKLELVAVLTGTPLNKAPAGKKFEGITVLYSKSADAHARYLVKVASSRGGSAVLVTGDAAVEKKAGSRIRTLRVSTFRKAFDSTGDSDGGGGERNSGGGNRNRSPRRRQQKSAPEKTERPERDMSDADAINELIDLVD